MWSKRGARGLVQCKLTHLSHVTGKYEDLVTRLKYLLTLLTLICFHYFQATKYNYSSSYPLLNRPSISDLIFSESCYSVPIPKVASTFVQSLKVGTVLKRSRTREPSLFLFEHKQDAQKPAILLFHVL
jgi:hypothetical protein